MATREPLYSGAQESPWEQQGVDLPRSARQKHIYEVIFPTQKMTPKSHCFSALEIATLLLAR